MLEHLQIRNLAVIDELTLELAQGFTVLTGETGAGKSILIDAVGLILGMRADTSLVRAGNPQAEVTAEFVLAPDSPARDWLAVHELNDEDDPWRCVIRRTVQATGRTRAFVNDRPVALATLRELGEQLVEIFGQGESQTLVRAEVQRELLDAHLDDPAALARTADAARECQRLEHEMQHLRTAASHDPAQLDFLRFQLQELDALGLTPDEPEQLETEHRQLANAGRLLQEGGALREALYGDDNGLYDQLAGASHTLETLAGLHPGFSAIAELTTAAQDQIREADEALRDLLERLDLDPARLAEVEQRMTALHDLARKHHLRAAELPAHRERLAAELDSLGNSAEQLDRLEQQAAQARKAYDKAAATLSRQRQAAAQKLSSEVSELVHELGMAKALFRITVEADAAAPPRVWGSDRTRFDFTANPGQPARPLNKVASGGELSRISLALQVAAQRTTAVATMIFDEVDAGIGGGVAEIVGTQLATLGERRQVLCVTHLAQVAAQGSQHLHIRKEIVDEQTYTRVQPLGQAGRVSELARMAGGRKVTRATEAHARELLEGKSD